MSIPTSPRMCDGDGEQNCAAAVVLGTGVALGRAGEDAAAAHLAGAHGLEIVARNWRIALEELRGELDLIAREPRSNTLVVCEVKSRVRGATRGGASAALGTRQQLRIRRLTAVMLATGDFPAARVRFDLVALDLGAHGRTSPTRLTHIPDAW
jgi:putative endonuclease